MIWDLLVNEYDHVKGIYTTAQVAQPWNRVVSSLDQTALNLVHTTPLGSPLCDDPRLAWQFITISHIPFLFTAQVLMSNEGTDIHNPGGPRPRTTDTNRLYSAHGITCRTKHNLPTV